MICNIKLIYSNNYDEINYNKFNTDLIIAVFNKREDTQGLESSRL